MATVQYVTNPLTGNTAIAFLLEGKDGFEYEWNPEQGLILNYDFDIPSGTEILVEYKPDHILSFITL